MPEAADHRPVVARLHRHLPARTQPRPDPRTPPVVGPLAEGRRQRRRVASRRSWSTRSAPRCPRPTAPRCAARGATSRPGPPNASARRRWRLAKADAEPRRRRTRPSSTCAATWAGPRGSRARARCRGVSPPTSGPTRCTPSPTRGSRSRTSWRSWATPGCRCASPRARRSPTCRRSSATSSPTARRRSSRAACSTSRTATRASEPTPLEPGTAYDIELELEAMSWTFEAGHRVRLDLAGSRLAERVVAARTGDAHDRACDRDVGAAGARRARSRRRMHRWSRRPTAGRPTPRPRNSPRTTRRRGGSRGTSRTTSSRTRHVGERRQHGRLRRRCGERTPVVPGAVRRRGRGLDRRSRDGVGDEPRRVRAAVPRGDVLLARG